MTSILLRQSQTALQPVRDHVLAEAGREGERIVAQARAAAQAAIRQAHQEAEAMLEAARQEGEAQAAESVARDVARARRQARGVVLAAQERVRQRARDAVQAAVRALRDEAGYPDLLAALTASARAVLGEDAVIREAPDGGVLAEHASRRIDLSLPTLAERAFAEHGREVARLWA